MNVEEWLRGVTYRPGWSVQYAGSVDNNEYVTVRAAAPDVCVPGATFTTAPLFRVPDEIVTRTQLLDWVIDTCIPGVEAHERYEWFRIDGQHWRDPHAPGMPAFAVDLEQ
jgi:hypothetical protein